MFTTTKKKRVFILSILISLIVVVIAGVGLGIYFLVRDNASMTLAKRQAVFGRAINASSPKPKEEEIDLSKLPSGVSASSVVVSNDRYFVINTSSNIFVVYDTSSASYVDIGSKLNFDSVQGLYGNLIIVSYGSNSYLFNLDSLAILANLSNISYTYESGCLLLASNNKSPILFYESGQPVENLYACVLNVDSSSKIFSAYEADNLINVAMSNNMLLATFANKTEVYKLGESLSLKKSFDNTADLSSSFTNVTSLVAGGTYYITEYHRAFALEENIILVEKSLVVNDNNFDITGVLSNGQRRNYKNYYYVIDLENDVQFDIESNEAVLEAIDINVSSDYIAILSTPIQDKTTLVDDSQKIAYYQIAKVKKEYELIKMVEYDYSSLGLVVGYNGTGLFTSGGVNSSYINFDGTKQDFSGLNDENSKITMSTYDDVVVISSILGEKSFYTKDSTLLTSRTFSQVSPYVNGGAVGLSAGYYYLVSETNPLKVINGFAEEFAQYVFMGIGYFFTGTEDNYNVYSMNGELLYENVSVVVTYNSGMHQVILSITSQEVSKVLKIVPIENQITSKNLVKYFVERNQTNTFASTSSQEKSAVGDNISLDRTISYSSRSENTNAGGIAQTSYTVSFSNLSALQYRSYSSLNVKEASLIPGFNQGTTGQYNVYKVPAEASTDGVAHTFTFEGVYFVGDNEHCTLAIIRLQDNGEYYYMVTLAVVDAYLSKVSAYTKENDDSIYSTMYFYDYRSDVIQSVDAVNGNETLALSYDDMKTKLVGVTWYDYPNVDQTPYSPSDSEITITPRQIDLETAGFDGGLIFTSYKANQMTISFSLKNTYMATSQKTPVIGYGGTKDCGKYTVHYSSSIVTVTAKEGYYLTYFDVWTSNYSDSSYTTLTSATREASYSGTFAKLYLLVNNAKQYVQLRDVSIVESFSQLNLIRYNEVIVEKLDESGEVILDEDEEPVLEVVEEDDFEYLNTLYYFYGYGPEIRAVRNPARIGFTNFENSTSVEIPERDGYTFKGYVLVEIDLETGERTQVSEIINENGTLSIVPGTDEVPGEEEYYADMYLMPQGETVGDYYLEAIYEANTYTINYHINKNDYDLGTNVLYDSNDNLTRKQIITEVSYYKVIESLHDITIDDYNLDNNKAYGTNNCTYRGYDFLGWFYIDSTTGEEIELKAGDIYTIVGNLRVYAKWEAQKYTLEFDANVGFYGAYQNILVGGYVYDIDNAYYSENFVYTNKTNPELDLFITAGTEFDQTNLITKQIVYAGMYGVMPKLEGIRVTNEGAEEQYVFLGWYSHKYIQLENENYEALVTGVDVNGNPIIKYTSGKEVDIVPEIVNEETGERKLTLYAHYRRIVYSYTLKASVDSNALDDNNDILPYALKYTVDGSTAEGVKAQYSTDGIYTSYDGNSGYEDVECKTWNVQNVTNPVYNFYVPQGENVAVNAIVNEGYYISSIVVKMPDYRGGQVEFSQYAIWDSATLGDYSLDEPNIPEISGIGNINVYSSGFNLQVVLENFYDTIERTVATTPLCATIELNFSSMKFKNEFTISGLYESPEGNVSSVTGDGRVTNAAGETITKQEGIIYGYTNTYKAVPGITATIGSVPDSYVKTITMDGDILAELSYQYGSETVDSTISSTPIFYHIMQVNVPYESAVWTKEKDGTIYKTTIYNIAAEDETGTIIVTLTLTYYYVKADTTLNYYTYDFSVKNKMNHEFDICFEDIFSSVGFNLYDADYSTEDQGLIPNTENSAISKRATITVTTGDNYYNGYYAEEMTPTRYMRYNIIPTENYFISSISISYNGSDRYIVAYPTIAINNDGGSINISQTAGYLPYSASSPLVGSEQYALLQSTNVSIAWLSGRGFAVTINQVMHDIVISVTMLEYKLFQVQTPGTSDETFEINEQLVNAKTNSFETGVAIQKGIYYYKTTGVIGTNQETLTYCNWVIAGKQDDIETITVKPNISGIVSYKVKSVIPSGMSNIIYIDEDGYAQYDLLNTSNNGHKAAVELAVDSAGLLVNSYLGRGTQMMDSIKDQISTVVPNNTTGENGQLYTLDSTAFSFGGVAGPFSNIVAYYGDANTGTSAYKAYDSSFINVSFTGGTITLFVYGIKGYKLSSLIVELYLVEDGSGEVGSQTKVYTLLPDAVEISDLTSSQTITLTIPKLQNSQYELRLFQKPIEYEVVYDKADDAGDDNAPQGEVNSTTHLYNVPSAIRTDAYYTKIGYTTIGYSKQLMTGNTLTEADCDFLLPGYVDEADKDKSSTIYENLWAGYESDSNKTVTLYTIYKANEYNIIYNSNDNSVSNGTSPAETVTYGETKVLFDSAFGSLNDIARFGYTFNGWYSAVEGGIKITAGTVLDVEIFEQIKNLQDDKSVVLYAQYTAKTFTITIDKNDISSGNGTSTGVVEAGSLTQKLTFDDTTKEFVYPTITRIGYDYKGLRCIQTLAADAKALSSADYLSATDFNWSFMVSGGFTKAAMDTINSSEKITLYATYTPQVFNYYINLNNTKMSNYGAEATVTYNGASYVETDHFVDGLVISIEFDAMFGTLPTIKLPGYDVIGLFSSKEASLTDTYDGVILSTTAFNILLYSSLYYTDASNQDTSLTTMYENGEKKFSIYAHYSVKQIEVTYAGGSSNNVEFVDDVGSFNAYQGVSYTPGSNSAIGEYGGSAIVDILPSAGKYVSQLIINYTQQETRTITINFTFNNETKTVSYSVSTNGSLGVFSKLSGTYSDTANGMYFYITSYAATQAFNRDTFRIVLGFDFLKESVTVETVEKDQMYNASFFVENSSGNWALYQTKQCAYGSDKISSGITNPTLAGKSFSWWCTDSSLSTQLTSSQTIKENSSFYAYFSEVGTISSVSFYVWNLESGSYELVEKTSCFGMYTSTMPSPSSDAWPNGYYFSGWQVQSYIPSSYLTYENGNFDTKYYIDRELMVFACYYSKGFTEPSHRILRSTTTTSAKQVGTSLVDRSAYSVADKGTVFYDEYYYTKTVYLDVSISTIDLYKFEYNKTGEYAPVQFYDYITYVGITSGNYSNNINAALNNLDYVVTSTRGSQSVRLQSYTYTYTKTEKWIVDTVKEEIEVEVPDGVDEEGNEKTKKEIQEIEKVVFKKQSQTTDETVQKKAAYNEMKNDEGITHYIVVFLSPRSEDSYVPFEDYTTAGGVTYTVYTSVSFPAP